MFVPKIVRYLKTKTWVTSAVFLAALLSACVLFEPKGKTDGEEIDFSDAIPLFEEQYAIAEKRDWSPEEGVEHSALGTLNPIVFEAGKSPLRYPGSKIDFNLFSGVHFLAVVDEVKGNGTNHFVTKGHIVGFEDGTFLLTSFKNLLSGTISIAEIGNYNVVFTSDGKYRVSKLNDYDFPELEPPAPELPGPKLTGKAMQKLAASLGKQATRQIAYAVYYDSTALVAAGGEDSLKAKIVAAVDETNAVYVRSGIDVELVLVDTQAVAYTETGSIKADLEALQDVDDGKLDTIQALRDSSKADLVTLIIENGGGNFAGLGYVMTSISTGFADYGYNVVIRAGLTPGWYTMTHELGHNMGCQHDIKTTKDSGAFTYSHGWIFKGKDKIGYKTIMSYGNNFRLGYFSNPDLEYQKKKLGANKAKNAQTIQLTASTIASFKGTDTAASASISFPTAGSAFGGDRLMIVADIEDDVGLDSVLFQDSAGGSIQTLGKVTQLPWKYFATGLDSGSHKLFLKVFDKGGHTTISDTISVTMGETGANSGWSEAYLGSSGLNGVGDTLQDTLTLTSQSAGIVTNHDDLQFVYQGFTGNANVRAGIAKVPDLGGNGRAGIMIRDTVDGVGRMAFLSVGADNNLTIQSRSSTSRKASTKILATDLESPVYLMFVRKSNLLTAYRSEDGSAWTYLTKVNIAAKSKVYAGLAVTSGDSTVMDTAQFIGYSADTSGNNPPTVSVGGLTSGTVFNTGDTLALSASVGDLDGVKTIQKVSFFQGDSLISEDDAKPYLANMVLATDTAGTIQVRVYDAAGDSSTQSFSISVLDTNQHVVLASKDTYVRDGKYAKANYGTKTTLLVQSNATAGKTLRSIVQFPISEFDSLSKATLRLFGGLSSSSDDSIQVNIYRYADTNWVESGKTGLKDNDASDASFTDSLGTFQVSSPNLKWFEVDVTDMTDSLRRAGETSISFGIKATHTTSTMASFYSSTQSYGGPPQLVMTKQ